MQRITRTVPVELTAYQLSKLPVEYTVVQLQPGNENPICIRLLATRFMITRLQHRV